MWQFAAFYPKLFFIDARCVIPILIYLFHWSWETFYIGMTGTCFFYGMNLLGYTPEAFVRIVRCYLSGATRTRGDVVKIRRIYRIR